MTDPNALIEFLPQEPPFRFVDRIESLSFGEKVVAEVTFAADHPVFDGHLPGRPLVPGVILIEATAQVSAFVLIDPDAEGRVFGYLAEVRRIRFRRPVEPGETVTLESSLVRKLGSAASFDVVARVGDQVAAEGEIVVGGMAG